MGQIKDITGQTFGRWKVLRLSERRTPDGKGIYWDCECQCAQRTARTVYGGDLKRIGRKQGSSASCGCLMREKAAERFTTHGLSKHPAYKTWQHVHTRCYDQADESYPLYGGRGIKVCFAWWTFEGFWKDMESTWSAGRSLDRIDTDGDYTAANCRWATPKEQASNRRNNHILQTPHGPMTVTQIAEQYGIKPVTLFSRIRYGWKGAELVAPLKRKKKG